MPDHNCSSSHCLHGLTSNRGDDYGSLEYVEVDPSGRYGRYKEVLGKGAFKTVYRAFDQEEGIEVAWNQVQVQDVVQTEEDVDRLYSEVHLLKTLKHKNIMKFYHSWVDRDANTINFITEVFTSGTLRQYRKRHRHVNIKAVKNWSRQILRGLLYLHSHDPPIIHRDLKCDNILINGNQGEVKIGDLGLATILQHAYAAHSVIGTPEYMAPELYEEEYTELVDIYSFGMCILEMVTSEYPYSECSNAAQIYKKVISGKKPEALKKVQDPETCQFIEKCLATVSRRLPARELLMDPFLQCDGVQDQVQPFTQIGRMLWKANDSEELHGKSATVHISYKLKETLPSFPEESNDYFLSAPDELESGEAADNNSCKPLAPLSREERARSVDFRVNGKLKEDDAVYLRLRIADPEGQVRNVHFPFDVESDTALCVASEMVAELDLTDQDVTKIAEMIDAAILALVPEWKPGVAIDEACDGEGLLDPVTGNAFDDDHLGIISNFDPLSTLVSDGPFEEMSRSLAVENAPQRVDGTMYGRFEEVTYHCHRTDFLTGVADEQCTVSSDTSDTVRERAVWDSTDGSSSPDSQVMKRTLPRDDAIVPVFRECLNSEKDDTAFSDIVDSASRDEQSTYIYKTWEGVVWQAPCTDTASSPMGPQNLCRQDMTIECSQDDILRDDDMQDELAADELLKLALKQEEELQELQRKHEEAVAELKNRLQQQKSLKLSAAANVDSHDRQST